MSQNNEASGRDRVCQEILEIMETYREQEASDYGVGTPGGLEHMGDVWRKIEKWEDMIKGENNVSID